MMGITLPVPVRAISTLLRLRMIQIFRTCMHKSEVRFFKGLHVPFHYYRLSNHDNTQVPLAKYRVYFPVLL